MHRYLLHNGEIQNTDSVLLSPGQVGFLNGWGVFSTLRVAQGALFAFDRHFARMKKDAALLHVPFEYSPEYLNDMLLKLVRANNALEATLRVAVVRNRGGLFESPAIVRDSDLVAFTADLNDWGEGVHLTYTPNARHGASRFSGTKITSWAQNLVLYEEAHQRGFDETILLNEDGQVSECTSANIFVIEGRSVWTPPLSTSGCLPGVTRAILLEEISSAAVPIGERDLTPSELEACDQVFITSTTRDLLPVLTIDGEPLTHAPEMLAKLREDFLRYRSTYLDNIHETTEWSVA